MFFAIALLRLEAVISPGQALTESSSTTAASQENESSDESSQSSESSDSSDSEPRSKKRKRIKVKKTRRNPIKLRVDFMRGMFILSKLLKAIVHPEMKVVKALSE